MNKVDSAVVRALRSDLDAALRDIRYLSLIVLCHRRLIAVTQYSLHAAHFNYVPNGMHARRDGFNLTAEPTSACWREPPADFAYVAPKIMAEREIATGGDL